MTGVLIMFVAAFLVLGSLESVTGVMLAVGLVLLVVIVLSGVLLGVVCDIFDPHGIGAYVGPPQQVTVVPAPAGFMLALAGGLAGMGSGAMAGVPAAIGVMFLIGNMHSNPNLAYYIQLTLVLIYLVDFILGYFAGTAMRLALDKDSAGATPRILVGILIGFFVIALGQSAVQNLIQPAQKNYICVFGW